MLKQLTLRNVGPVPKMDLELGSRLNLITGDNGLGKSFLLDLAWWALTRKWPAEINTNLTSGFMARPTDPEVPAEIAFSIKSKTKVVTYKSAYSAKNGGWIGKAGRPWNPGLVLYAHADGAFSIWDPARNYWKTTGTADVQDRPAAYVLSPKEVWDGAVSTVGGRDVVISNGLVRDWANWINAKGIDAKRMREVLKVLSPSPAASDQITPGPLVRVGSDARDVPSVTMPYGVNVPIVHASAGVKRITALAYMLVWAWKEHVIATEQIKEPRARNVVMIVDEIESHLHPKWQRSILGALVYINKQMYKDASIQLLISTHSPLVLASAEATFDNSSDKWFDFDLERTKKKEGFEAVVREREFVRHGDISNWLTSEAFDLRYPGSVDAENVIEEANALLNGKDLDFKAYSALTEKLRSVLGDSDPFWIRWNFIKSKMATKSELAK